jgi:hypothetical protein
MVRGVNVLGVRGEVGWLVAGEGVPGGGTGGGWAVALCSVRAREEGERIWGGRDRMLHNSRRCRRSCSHLC